VFWWIRPHGYTRAFCRVNGEQVDYERAAAAALSLETEEERVAREARAAAPPPPPLLVRMRTGAAVGFGAGVLAGVVIGVLEGVVIASGGFGGEAQVFWYGPLSHAVLLGGLGLAGGAVLGLLPMQREEVRTWVAPFGFAACLLPLGLAITVFRLRRDVYLEQMPPVSVLLGVLLATGVLALIILGPGRRFFSSKAGRIAEPLPALVLLLVVCLAGAIASAAIGGAGGAARPAEIPPALRDRPNVILVMVDTLRSDHLSCYGAERVSTPNLCRLAADGGTLYQAFSHASWTKPATASLLTSRLPSSHQAIAKPSVLSPDVDMIAEVMRGHGYTTGGIVSNINLAPSFGFDQGYDEYTFLGPDYLAGAQESSSKLILYNIARAVWFKLKPKLVPGIHFSDFYQDSQVVNAAAFDWLDRHRSERFFLFLHYMDPHDPYFAHPYDGHGIARVSTPHPDPKQAEEMQRLYEGEVTYLDANFGALLAELERLGLYEDTVIALVSDHGEEFHEHGGWWHGLTLYEEQIHVPLIVKWARSVAPPAETSHLALARLIDVTPTLIGVTGAEVPASMQGIDLRTAAESRNEKDRQVFSEEDHEGNVLWSLRTEKLKLIHANAHNPRGLPERELFAIEQDPKERAPLDLVSESEAVRRLELHAKLQREAAEGAAVAKAEEAEMSFEECEQLRMLGYVEDCSHLQP